ncbi:MAG: 50S ribosomal protein L3 [Candidatus Hermodarchaeota archaeon]
MGHRKKHAPKRGSLAFSPRKRAKRKTARWRKWPLASQFEEPRLLGFAGYKVGMTHVALIEDRPYSPQYKQELFTPVTVVEVPPITIFGIRLYGFDPMWGRLVIGERWITELEELNKKLVLPRMTERDAYGHDMEDLKEKLSKTDCIRVLAHTRPVNAGTPQKVPDIVEIELGGKDRDKVFDFALELMGTEVNVKDLFKEGDYIDVTSVTKGKGFQGPVKRFGIKILPRKTRKGRRAVGAIGPWSPARVSWTVPRAGKMGYHPRTEYNKRILKIDDDGEAITPASGFKRYGTMKGDYLVIKGSIPGSTKRLVRLRVAMRPNRVPLKPQVSWISTVST